MFVPSHADVNSWLVTFGFQLYNVIPGYRKPSTQAMEPSYELVRTQIKTQEWDSTKVSASLSPSPPLTLQNISFFQLHSFPTSLASRHALWSHTPEGAASYRGHNTAQRAGSRPLVPVLGNGVRLNSSCNCPAIREIHSPFSPPLAIDFISVLQR